MGLIFGLCLGSADSAGSERCSPLLCEVSVRPWTCRATRTRKLSARCESEPTSRLPPRTGTASVGEDYRRAIRRVVSEAPDDQRTRLTRVCVEAELMHQSMAIPRTHQHVTASVLPLQRQTQHVGTSDGALAAFRKAQRRHELALEQVMQQMQDVS